VTRFAEARALEAEVDDLADRLETRKALDRAKGVLMAKGLTEPEAFRRLQKLAMDRRLTLKQVAEAIVLAADAEG
ncbi:MAG: ANTAR domain-containing response regulator, partial [Coriobacteriia bacterium]